MKLLCFRITLIHAAVIGLFQQVASGEGSSDPLSVVPQPIATATSVKYDWDIVYVRAARFGDKRNSFWPDAQEPLFADPGADLMLLHPDGVEELLVAGGKGAVTDPVVSFDGEWVYYAYFHDLSGVTRPLPGIEGFPKAGADIYKVHVKSRKIVRLTHQEFTPNNGAADWSADYRTPEKGKFALPYGVFNLGPCPVPGGKIVFTSSRNGFRPPRMGAGMGHPTLQLFTMDDDGQNVEQIGHLNIGSTLHPVILKDGRIMFSSLENQGIRNNKMWGIWSIHPDGTNWGPIVSAHMTVGAGTLVHFQTQLSDERIVWEWYYAGHTNSGFGAYFVQPIGPTDGAAPFGPGDRSDPINRYASVSRSLMPKGWMALRFAAFGVRPLTPFTHGEDRPAALLNPQDATSRAGKFTHPSGAPNNHLLTAYAPQAGYQGNGGAPVDSGIYLIKDGQPFETPNQMYLIKNDPEYNEQWPRALVAYEQIYGVKKPRQLPTLANDGTRSNYLPEGTPFGLVGTSSLYKRESYPEGKVPQEQVTAGYRGGNDPWQDLGPLDNAQNWREQGADAGRYSNSDIHAVRILAQEPTTERRPRLFFNHPTERLRILGEIPVRKYRDDQQPIDPDGNPDTSFLAKVPANIAWTFQTLDKNGMVLNMAQTWHQVRPGEIRTNCGGCHAHSQKPTDFSLTVAARDDYDLWDLTRETPLLTTKAADESTKRWGVRKQWDSADQTGVRFSADVKNVEFYRDIKPIFDRSCVACHTKNDTKPAGNLVLDDDGLMTKIVGGWMANVEQGQALPGTYVRLALDNGRGDGGGKSTRLGYNPVGMSNTWPYPMASRYIWMLQSRRSLLVWKVFGKRLDGFTNEDHPAEPEPGAGYLVYKGRRLEANDPYLRQHPSSVNYSGSIMPPTEAIEGKYVGRDGANVRVTALTDEDRLTLVRWIDLGCPIDLDYDSSKPEKRGFGWMCDENRPTLTMALPRAGNQSQLERFLIGMDSRYTGLDLSSFQVSADFAVDGIAAGENLASKFVALPDSRWEYVLKSPIAKMASGKLSVSIKNRQGNISIIERRFTVGTALEPSER